MLSLLPVVHNRALPREPAVSTEVELSVNCGCGERRYYSSTLLPLDSPRRCFSCGSVNGTLLFLLQGLRLRQQEQPPDEGAGGAAPVQGGRAEPRRLRPAGSGHGQRHLPQVCLGFFFIIPPNFTRAGPLWRKIKSL